MAAVKRAQPHQAAQDIGQMTSEDAAVGVQFVDDDVLQVFKELDPLGVVRQDVGVEHVGIGDLTIWPASRMALRAAAWVSPS